MTYTIYDLSSKALSMLNDFYNNRIITTLSRTETNNYNVTININAILKINDGNITIDLGGKLYTINTTDYARLEIF